MTSDAVALALCEVETWVGRSGRDPDADRCREWAETLLPHDRLKDALGYLRSAGSPRPPSTCGLVVVRYFARLGCKCREVTSAYIPDVAAGKSDGAIVHIQRVAQRHGAWMSRIERCQEPDIGDVLGIEVGNPHVCVVRGKRIVNGETVIDSDEGGQLGGTVTKHRSRKFIAGRVTASLEDIRDGVSLRVGYQRVIYTRISAQRIAETPELCR